MQHVKHAGSTHDTDNGLTKVASAHPALTWVSPAEQQVFTLGQDATLPEMIFEFHTAVTGEYRWSWVMEWEAKTSGLKERERKGQTLKAFNESGEFNSGNKAWVVDFGKILGGTLTVTVEVGEHRLTRTVSIIGQNPTLEQVGEFVASLADMDGFEKLLEQETGTRHFINLDGEPIVSFDQGYGITQMTQPAPSYEQVWSWKANIQGGSSIYQEKAQAAKKYLGQAGRAFTDEQLRFEVLSRWNGGAYHQWDATSLQWVRKQNLLCDSATGNVGWSMSNGKNQDKTESELHARDQATYKKGSKGQSAEHPWVYSGVCYADHVLGQ